MFLSFSLSSLFANWDYSNYSIKRWLLTVLKRRRGRKKSGRIFFLFPFSISTTTTTTIATFSASSSSSSSFFSSERFNRCFYLLPRIGKKCREFSCERFTRLTHSQYSDVYTVCQFDNYFLFPSLSICNLMPLIKIENLLREDIFFSNLVAEKILNSYISLYNSLFTQLKSLNCQILYLKYLISSFQVNKYYNLLIYETYACTHHKTSISNEWLKLTIKFARLLLQQASRNMNALETNSLQWKT